MLKITDGITPSNINSVPIHKYNIKPTDDYAIKINKILDVKREKITID